MISQENLKRWQAKLVAVCFIVLTLLGNFWILQLAIGQEVPAWFFHTLVLAVSGVIFGGSSLLWHNYMDAELDGLAKMEGEESDGVESRE